MCSRCVKGKSDGCAVGVFRERVTHMPSITDQMRSRPSMEKVHLNVFLVVALWDEQETDEGKTLQVQQQLGCPRPADLALYDVGGAR